MQGQHQSISNRSKELKEILHRIVSFSDFYLGKAVYHLYSLGYSHRKIARILDMSPTAILEKFPIPKKEDHEPQP